MNAYSLWLEKDLTAEARAGRLPPAFEIDEPLQTTADQLEAGRHPILTGPSGIGKTTIVYELVRRVRAASTPSPLAGRRVLQFSLQKRLGTLKDRYELAVEFNKLIDAVRHARRPPALFIRDIHLAYVFDLEDALARLACVTGAIIIGEGPESAVCRLLEYEPALQQCFVRVPVEEPTLEQAERILQGWTQGQAQRHRISFAPDAIEQALTLTHRFVPRTHLPRKAIDLLTQSAAQARHRRTVSADTVIRRFCSQYRVPRVLVDPALPLDLDRVRYVFARAIFGQADAVNAIVDTVGVLKSGLADVRRPLAALLLVGPTGVGKTYIAQLLAEVLFGRRDRVIRVNMADYAGDSDGRKLFGDPDAESSKEAAIRGQLATKIAGYPFGVVLLDEFEKAHRSVHDRFLQLLDEGVFIDGFSESVPCRSLIFVATSNAGHEHTTAKSFGFAPRGGNHEQSLLNRLERHFRFELLNRFDRIVHFTPLGPNEARSIALAELRRLAQRTGIRQRRLTVVVERAVVDWIVQRGFDPERGARYLRHTVEQHATAALARVIARDQPAPGSRLRLMVRAGEVRACLDLVCPTSAEKVSADAAGSVKAVQHAVPMRVRPQSCPSAVGAAQREVIGV